MAKKKYKNVKEAFPDLLESNIYKEKYTGLKMERPQFSRLCKLVQRGDTIVFDSVSRMSRNAEEGYQQYMDWYTRGITLIFLKEPQINTTAYAELENKQIQIARGSLPDGAIGKLLESFASFLGSRTVATALPFPFSFCIPETGNLLFIMESNDLVSPSSHPPSPFLCPLSAYISKQQTVNHQQQ